MKTRIIDTKSLASYGAVLASVGISSHAQAEIKDLDLAGNLPPSLVYSYSAYQNFNLLGAYGNGNQFGQYNDTTGKDLIATATGTLFRLVGTSTTTIGPGFTGGNFVEFGVGDTGDRLIGFLTSDDKAGWLKINLGGAGGTINYLAAAINDAAGGTIHAGDYIEGNIPNAPEPSNIALISLGLLATGASGIRKLRKTAKSKPQNLLNS